MVIQFYFFTFIDSLSGAVLYHSGQGSQRKQGPIARMISPKKAIQYRFPTLRLVSDLALFGENRFYTNSSLLALFKMCLPCPHTTTSEIRSPVRPPNSALSNTGPNTFSSVKIATFLALNQGKTRSVNNFCPSKMLQWDLKILLKFDKAVGLCAFQQRSPTSYAPKRKWIHSEFTAKRFFFSLLFLFSTRYF